MQIKYEINGFTYIFIEELLQSTAEYKEKLKDKIEKYGCIIQSSEIHRSFWFKGYIKINILIPEKYIFEYMKS